MGRPSLADQRRIAESLCPDLLRRLDELEALTASGEADRDREECATAALCGLGEWIEWTMGGEHDAD